MTQKNIIHHIILAFIFVVVVFNQLSCIYIPKFNPCVQSPASKNHLISCFIHPTKLPISQLLLVRLTSFQSHWTPHAVIQFNSSSHISIAQKVFDIQKLAKSNILYFRDPYFLLSHADCLYNYGCIGQIDLAGILARNICV